MKKRLVSLMLVMAMTMSVVLGGCGNSQKESSSSDVSKVESTATQEKSSESVASTEEKAELEEKTIQVLLFGPGKQADSDKVWAQFNEMLQEYVPNTTVEFTVVPTSEYKDNYNRMLAAEEAYDLTWVGYATNLQTHMKDGNLMPLDDLLDEYGQGIKEIVTDEVLDIHRYSDGELYYVLSWQGLVGEKRAMRVPTEMVEIVEKEHPNWLAETQKAVSEWFNEGLSIRPVCEQLDKFFTTLKAAGINYYGFGKSSELQFLSYYEHSRTRLIAAQTGVGITIGDPNFKAIDTYTNEDYRIRCEYLAKWFEEGVIPSDIMSASSSQYKFVENGEYNENTVLFACHNLWVDSQELTYEAKAGVPLSFITIEDQGTLTPGKDTGMAIPYCADEPERGMMVLNALYTVPELYQLLVYGIEGTHYTKNADGTITHVGLASSSSPYGLNNWYFGTCENGLATDAGQLTFYDELKEAEASLYKNPFVNFVYDNSKTKDVIAALDAIGTEYNVQLRTGAFGKDWEAKFDEYLKLRKEAGIDRLIEDYQAQLDAYMKENNITSW